MKRTIITLLLINLFLSSYSQQNDREQEKREFDITISFDTYWHYFRMKRNPLLSYQETHDGANWRTPFLIPKKYYDGDYRPDIKISDWGKSKWDKPQKYVDLRSSNFYLVEKDDGLTGIKRTYSWSSFSDTIHFNIYDSIFPYDNRFLVVNKRKNVIVDNGWDFTFHSGNVEWGEWRDVGFRKDVAYCGYIRGVQFGIENVLRFTQEFSDKISTFRPEFSNYVYTHNEYPSLLSNGFVIIAAPKGKEDQLVEYIFYSNLSEKTGDPDENHYYEMRYILPTQIKSVKERHLEKRRLTAEEQIYILDRENRMFMFLDRRHNFLSGVIIEERIAIDTEETEIQSSQTDTLKLTPLGKQGTPLPSDVSTTNISTSIAIITFENAENSKFAFDNYLDYYETVNVIQSGKIYEHINATGFKDEHDRYDIGWKLVPVGETDVITAKVQKVKISDFDPAKVIFSTKEGTQYKADYNSGNQTFAVTLPSSADNNVQEIFALYNLGKGDFRMLGKLNVVSYKKQQPKVKVVFVNNYSINIEQLKAELNKIYKPVGVDWQVEPDEFQISADLNNIFANPSSFLENYNDKMDLLIAEYKKAKSNSFDKKASYIFILNYGSDTNDKTRNAQGYMPRGRQFGFIFKAAIDNQNAIPQVIAHELGHGCFTLKHTFDKDYGNTAKETQSTIDNLMDYSANASHLAKWQWDIIQNPAVFAGLTDKDEEGMYKQQDLTELIQIMQGLGNSQFLVLRNCEENQYYSSDAPKTNIINMNNKLFKYIIGTYIPDRNTVEIDKSDKTTGKNIDDKTYSDLQIDKDAKEIVLLASDNGGVPVIVPCYQGVANRYIELCGYDINSEISTSTIEAITNDIRNCLVVQPAQSGRIHNYSSEKIENAEELEKLYGGKQKINDPTAGERHNTKAQLYITDETTSQEDLNRIREITQNKDTVIWLHKTSSNEWEIKSALPQMLGDAANLMKEANQAALKGIDAYAEFMYEALDYVANAVRVLKVPRYAWDDKDAHYKRIYAYVYKAVITVGTGGYYNAVVQLVTSYGLSEMIGESNPEIANVLRQMGDGRVEFAFTAGVWDGAIETVAGALNLVSLPYKAASEKGRQEIVNTYNQLKDFELVDEDGNVIESGIWAALKMGMKEEVSSTYRISHFSGEIALGVALCFVDPAALEAAGQKAIAITVRTLQFFDEIQGMAMKPLGYTLKFVKKAGGKIIGRVMKEGTLLFEIIDDKLAAKAKRVGGTVEENIDIPTDNIKQISKGADDKIILETKNGTKWELEGVAKGGDRFFKNIDEFKAAINRGEDVFYLGKYSDMRPRPANVQGHHGVNSVWMEHN